MFYCINYNSFVPLLTFTPAELHRFKKLMRRKIKQQDPPNNYRPSNYPISLLECAGWPSYSCPSFGVFKDPRQDRNNSTHSFALLFFSPIFIEQKKLRKFIKQISEAPHIFLFYFFGHFSGGGVCFANVFKLFPGSFCCGLHFISEALKQKNVSSCSRPFTALMRVVKIKPVEPFFYVV